MIKLLHALILFLSWSIFISTAKAKSAISVDSHYKSALDSLEQRSIADSPDWQNLIQYTARLLGKRTSEISSSNAFFANDGAHNAQSELRATLRAMLTPLKADQSGDDHPRCKFIARYEFLKNHVQFPSNIENIVCAKFNQWVNIDDVESVSLVFASGYFKNPASFYGHPLLKFNSSKVNTGGLLDITINNGAIVPPNENPLVYMVRGVFGGYQAAFSDTTFYQLNHSYSESDLRDLWDYQLNLNDSQKRKLILYSWELLSQRFTYRFFSKNCGYFLEDLLQYAIGKRLSPRNRIYAVPANTFFNAMQTSNNGKPLVSKISRTPSRHSRLNESFSSLSETGKAAVKNYVITQEFNQQLEPDIELAVIDTLTDYYSFLIAKTDKASKKQTLSQKRTKLYAKRLSLAAKTNDSFEDLTTSIESWSTPPHTGSRPSLVRFGYVRNSELGNGVWFRIRPVSYDLLDLDEGHVENSILNMFNLEATAFEDHLRISRFDLVSIKTLNISRTGLPGDGGLGWGLRFGLERANNSCIDCLLGHVSASAIKAKRLSPALSIYFEGEVSYHSNFKGGSLRTTTTAAAVAKPLRGWKTQLVVGKRFSIDGDADSETLVQWQNRIGDKPNRNIRLDLNYDGESEIHLGYGWYW